MTKEQLEELLKEVTGALYDAVRTDWDEVGYHELEDKLIERVEDALGVRFGDESDDSYRERILEAMPHGHVYTAEDLGCASGESIDEIGSRYGVSRKKRTT